MRKFNPKEYNRQHWGRQTANHPPTCPQKHTFCNIDYQWGNNQQQLTNLKAPGLPNVKLPPSQPQGVFFSYDMITEEGLDDWMAQSLNHTLPSLINPQTKLLPPAQEEEMRKRYSKKITSKQYQDQLYFKKEVKGNRKSSVQGKYKINQDPTYDPQLLTPKVILGTPIRLRQHIDDAPKQAPRPRRNAVLLLNDIHYTRLLKQMAKVKHKMAQTNQPVKQVVAQNLKQMLYSFNLQSMSRVTAQENVPNSIIQKQFQRIRQPVKDFIQINRNNFKRQEEIQDKARAAINNATKSAMEQIDILISKKPTTTIQYTKPDRAAKKKSVGGRAQVEVVEKKIDQKVHQLLNNMQVVSEHIDVQMSKLAMHLEEVPLRQFSSKTQYKWVAKAQQKLKEKENLLAIDCYKQALQWQPQFFIPIFNIAVLLQKEKMLSYAKQWFQLAKEFGTDQEHVSYGLALVQVKQLHFQAGLKEIDDLIQSLQAKRNKKIQMSYYYLRALCNKQLGNFDKARLDYQIILKQSKPSNYHSLSYFLLSVVFAKSRRYTPKFNCLAYMSWRQTLLLLFYEKPKKVREDSMSANDFVDQLSKLPFFCRFSKKLLKKLLDNSKYETVKKDSILFISPNQTTIIVNGLVSIFSHQRSITSPDTVSVLSQGGVLGAGQVDQNLSSKPNYWFLAKTSLEVLKISRAEFKMFWQGQITFEWDYKYNFLKNVQLFKGLCEYTLFRLCEAVQLKKYQQNEIIFNDCSYRSKFISKEGLGFCMGALKEPDPRFVNAKKNFKQENGFGKKKKLKSRMQMLLKKNIFKFNQLKFNRLKYPGLFILVDGKVQIEDDRGFRCKDILSPRDYFGQNLVIQSDGYQNYGRMVVDGPSASFYMVSAQKLLWAFTSIDKQLMTSNVKNRKEIETIKFLKNRFEECLEIKMAKLLAKKL